MRADVTVNLNVRREIKNEWENLRKHDVLFLVTVRPSVPFGMLVWYLAQVNHAFIFKLFLILKLSCLFQGLDTISENHFYLKLGLYMSEVVKWRECWTPMVGL